MRNMLQKDKIKKEIAFALFLFLIWQVFIHMTYLFRGADWSAYNVFGYRNEKKDSVDTVFVGGSSVYRFWNPLQAYNEHGFTSYDYTSSNFPSGVMMTALDELQKTQTPKLIVIDIRTFHSRLWDTTYPGGFRLYIDSMEPSIKRTKAIDYYGNIMNLTLDEKMPFYLDIAYYHTNGALSSERNWSFMDHRISEQLMKDTGYFAHGFLPGTAHYYFGAPEDRTEIHAKLRENIEQCYIDLLEYVKGSDTPVLLIESPFIPLENDLEEMNTLISMAEEYGVPILDTNKYIEEMGINYRTDFYDTNHVNILGAQKYTKFLGKYLAEYYDLPDHRDDEEYAEWDSRYEDYVEQAAQLKAQMWGVINQKERTIAGEEIIRKTVVPLEWLAMTDDSNLTLLFAKRNIENSASKMSLYALKHLGLSSEILSSEDGYIGVYSGSLKYADGLEAEYSDKIDMIWDTADDVPYTISHEKIIVNDQTYPVMQQGITAVVIDNNTTDIVDYATLDLDKEGGVVLRHLASAD